MIHLDNNATTKPCDDAVRAARDAMETDWHNPSASHRPGQAARRGVELARASLAALVGCKGRELVFTSGGTESIHLAIRGLLALMPESRRTVLSTPIEHEAIRDLLDALAHEGVATHRTVPINPHGYVTPEAFADSLDESVALASIQWANNETGVVQPISRLARIASERGVAFHTDATQGVGKLEIDLHGAHDRVSLLTCSGHKFHGIKGAGALFVRQGVRLRPLFHGTQELARRAGTENTPGIRAMGAAADAAREWLADPANRERVERLRDRLETHLLRECDGAVLISPPRGSERLWNTTNIAFAGVRAELLVMSLAEAGVSASAGSACASGAMESSPVIEAMDLPEGTPEDIAYSSVRFSLSRDTTDDEIDRACGIITRCVAGLAGTTI